MILPHVLRYCLLATTGVGLSSCFWFDENDTVQLGGNYQLVITTDGNNFLYFDDPESGTGEPLLSGISLTGETKDYLVVCKLNQYYLFSLKQPTQDAALATCSGPLSKRDFRLALYRVAQDSSIQLMPVL